VRLLLTLKRKGGGSWWDHAACLKYDRVGVTAAHVRHVACPATAWSGKVEGLRPLSGFLEKIAGQTR
jgi:hypothetical protein